MLPLVIAAGLTAGMPPIEFVVDCSGLPFGKDVTGKFEFTFRYECWNGDVLTTQVGGELRVPGSTLVIALASPLKDNRWQFGKLGNPGDETTLVIRGSKASRIKSVTFTGRVWTPSVYPRFATRPFRELGPPPREVKQ